MPSVGRSRRVVIGIVVGGVKNGESDRNDETFGIFIGVRGHWRQY